MSNYNAGSGVRDVYVKDSGNDMNDGRNATFAKGTLAGAKSAADALDPAPGLQSPAAIVDSGSSRYELEETFDITDNVQCALQFCSFATSFSSFTGSAVIMAAENAQAEVLTLSLNADDGLIGYSSNGKSRTALDSRAVIMNGPNQIGVSLDGATDQSFLNIGQVLARFSGSTGVSITSTGESPRYYQLNEINVSGDNCKGVSYDSPATAAAVYRVGAITYEENVGNPDTGAGCIGIEVVNGTIAGYSAEVIVETAFATAIGGDLINDSLLTEGIIYNKGNMNMTSRRHTGDIINEGALTVRIDEHVSGSIINSGILNGEINGVRYGTWVGDGGEKLATFSKEGGLPNSPENLGRLTIDTATESIVAAGILPTYSQTTGGNREITFRVLDADNLGVTYFSGALSAAGVDFNRLVSMSAITPLPVSQQVNLYFEVERTSGAFFGVSDPSIQVEIS